LDEGLVLGIEPCEDLDEEEEEELDEEVIDEEVEEVDETDEGDGLYYVCCRTGGNTPWGGDYPFDTVWEYISVGGATRVEAERICREEYTMIDPAGSGRYVPARVVRDEECD
jgi:hypothetical protein